MDDLALLATWRVGSCILSISMSSDGTHIATGASDTTVCVWDVKSGAMVVGPLKGHTDLVRSVAFSPDNTRIASGSSDHSIRIWDAVTGDLIAEPLRGHSRTVYWVSFSPDGNRIVSCSRDCTIRIWDTGSMRLICEPLRGHTGTIYSVASSPNGAYVVSGSEDCTVRIWDAHSGAPVGQPLRGHTDSIFSVTFSLDGARIISCSKDLDIRIWDALTGAPIGDPLRGHSGTVYSVASSPDSTRIVSGSRDQTIRIWDLQNGTFISAPLKEPIGAIYSLVFSPDSSRVVSASGDNTIRIWRTLYPERSPSMISRGMTAQDMFDCLLQHGCTDVSPSIDPDQYSTSAIAAGGFGDIWKGRMRNGVAIAVKCLRSHMPLAADEKGMKRTSREIYIWTKARHENVQELTGIIMFQGGLGMVSPWMENGNLLLYLKNNPGINRHSLCVQLATGLSYLHSINMVHGDLKALNVLVSKAGVLKISDFDHAILTSATLRFSKTTNPGGGTLRWMAPELLEQEDDTPAQRPPVTRNKQTDIYALGMTILEIVSGDMPYAEYRNDMSIYRAIDKKQLPRRPEQLTGTDEQTNMLWALLVRCWNHDPGARPEASFVLRFLQLFVVTQ